MFAIGGLLKFFGDLTGLVGPLSISFIVEYIERKTNKTNLTNENITVSNFINIGTPATPDNDNIIYDTSSDYFDENSKIYFPNWMDFITNGWIICVLVLIASLAQGTFSQASTHLVNLEGIRLKNALQGLVYRKTLALNLNNNSNNGSNSTKGNLHRRSSKNSNGNKNSNNKNDQKHNVIVNGKQQIEGNGEKTSLSPLSKQQKQQSNVQQSKYFHEDVDDGNNDEMQMQDAGTITNLMSEDTFNVMSFFWIAHYVWAIPLKVSLWLVLFLKIYVKCTGILSKTLSLFHTNYFELMDKCFSDTQFKTDIEQSLDLHLKGVYIILIVR
jgi:ABC-type multidrug transport system fused ATPase/permease subunit